MKTELKSLIANYEEELLIIQDMIKNNIKNMELATAAKHQVREKMVIEFIKKIKELDLCQRNTK